MHKLLPNVFCCFFFFSSSSFFLFFFVRFSSRSFPVFSTGKCAVSRGRNTWKIIRGLWESKFCHDFNLPSDIFSAGPKQTKTNSTFFSPNQFLSARSPRPQHEDHTLFPARKTEKLLKNFDFSFSSRVFPPGHTTRNARRFPRITRENY